MSLFIASLNSGSNANCYYVGNAAGAVLVDAGLSLRETEKRMKGLGLEMEKVKAIFVSHEHSDHITGLPGISRKYRVPVYITKATHSNSNIPLEEELVRDFVAEKAVDIGGLSVTAFRKSHDAADPHSFVISDEQVNVGVFTDIGHPCKRTIRFFKQCHAVFLESNYCADMLEKGNYPYHLKRRISGDDGHLSNDQALELFLSHRPRHLSHLILSHLSKNNNDPALVNRLFTEKAGPVQVFVASRYEASPVFTISSRRKAALVTAPPVSQLKLF